MKFLRNESGQMLVFTALTLMLILGFLALATDVGTLFHAKRQLQIAADAAATAGAIDQLYGLSKAQTITDARNAAAANGATNGSNGTVVTINTPPLNGYHESQGYVEAIIHQPNPTFFMSLFGFRSVTIGARAVAGAPGYSVSCIYLDGPTGNDLDMQGSAYIGPPQGDGVGCAMYVNSSSDNAVKITGGAAYANLSAINVFGTGTGSPGMPNGQSARYNTPPQNNPFGDTVTNGEPSLSACTSANTTSATSFSSPITINASNYGGVYCFSGANVDISNTTLEGGTFLFENGVVVADHGATQIGPPASGFTSPADAATLGATLDLYNGTYYQSTASTFNITAPTTQGAWNDGIALLIPTTNTQYTQTTCSHNPHSLTSQVYLQFGSSVGNIQGYIYAPNATLTLHDQGGSVSATGVVAANLCMIPGTMYTPSYNAVNPITTPLRSVALVE